MLRKRFGKYNIMRMGSTWVVIMGREVVFRGETKAECLEWVENYG